jgi:acyl dehydratase
MNMKVLFNKVDYMKPTFLGDKLKVNALLKSPLDCGVGTHSCITGIHKKAYSFGIFS